MFFLKEVSNNTSFRPAKSKQHMPSDKKIKGFIDLIDKERALKADLVAQVRVMAQEEELVRRQTEDMEAQQRIIAQEISKLQVKNEVSKNRLAYLTEDRVFFTLSGYLKAFLQSRKYEKVLRQVSFKVYNTLSNCMARKKFIPKIKEELSSIIKIERFQFHKKEMLVVVKQRPNQQVELQVSECSAPSKKVKAFVGSRILSQANYCRFSNIQNYLWLDLQKKSVLTIDEYVLGKAEIKLTMFLVKFKIRVQLQQYKYKCKFGLEHFYEHQVLPNYPRREMIFFAKMHVVNGILMLSIESISENAVRMVLPLHTQSTDYKGILDTFLSENLISLQQKKPFKKIIYAQHQAIITKFQAVFRSHKEQRLFKKHKQERQLKSKIVGSPKDMRFISYSENELLVMVAFDSQPRETPNVCKFKRKYADLILEEVAQVVEVRSKETFVTLVEVINRKIEKAEVLENINHMRRVQSLREVFKKFLQRGRLRSAARIQYLQIKLMEANGCKALLIVRNSSRIVGSIEVYIYKLHERKSQHKFVLRRDNHINLLIQKKEVEKLFHVSEKFCLLKPRRQADGQYVIEPTPIQLESALYFYKVHSHKKAMYLLDVQQIVKKTLTEPFAKKEIPKKDLLEMSHKDIEKEVMELINTKQPPLLRET